MKKNLGKQVRGTGKAVRMSNGGSVLDKAIRKIEIDLEGMDPDSDAAEALRTDLERLKDERGDYAGLPRERTN